MSTGTAVDVVMPQMGVSVSEGTITKWLKNVGDPVTADESLLEISTDKVDTEVPSPGSGVVSEILVQEGETVEVGTVLARIGGAVSAAPGPEPAAEEPVVEPVAETEAASAKEPPPSEPVVRQDGNGRAAVEEHRFVSPVVARIAAEHGLDPSLIEGTGRGGRVTKDDILAYVAAGDATPPAAAAEPPPAPPAPPEHAAASAPLAPPPPAPEAGAVELTERESAEPMSAMRRGIAEHMRRSLDTSAHVTSAIEVDMSKVSAIRERLKPEYERSYGVNPTYLAFVARAAVDSLRDWPWVNAELRGASIITRSFVNVGFAVALEGGKGLIVPVLKNAEGLSLLGIARGIADLAERARTKKLTPDDVQGGTFTITNPGSFGTILGTPIISQPQSAILGTYALVKRPWVIQDEAGKDAIAIRPIMNLTLTYDHRLVDGAYGAQFLRELREKLETWDEGSY